MSSSDIFDAHNTYYNLENVHTLVQHSALIKLKNSLLFIMCQNC